MGSTLRAIGIDLVGSLVVITIAIGGLQSVDEDVSTEAVGVGLCCGAVSLYVRDHEPLASVLDDFWGRLAFSGLEQLLIRLVGRTYSSRALFSGAVGGGIGTVLYRLVYGVVYDVPPARLRRQWSLPVGD